MRKIIFLYEVSAALVYMGEMSTPLISYRGQKSRLAENWNEYFPNSH